MDYNRKYYNRFTIAVVKWLNTVYLDGLGSLSSCERILNKYHRILQSRGKKEAIRFCKESRASLYRWLATISSIQEYKNLPLVGLPRDLRFLRFIKTERFYPTIRLVLSVLYFSRGLELPPILNILPITTPSNTSWNRELIGRDIKEFWGQLGCRHQRAVPKRVSWRKFHLSTKNGPNGQAMWSALADLKALPPCLVESIKFIGGKLLTSRMETLVEFGHVVYDFFNVQPTRFRKIACISDQEGKSREVAILDYWSQTALRPLHEFLFSYLRRIPQDCTFNQGSFRDKLGKGNNDFFYSIDLTTATDRFPIDLISDVLKFRFTDDYVHHWRNIMVGYPFESQSGPLRYSVGNPMGAYSSWNSFALSHHYVVFHCCKNLGVNWKSAPYVLLGDDIVINHTPLAQEYMRVLTSLGVEFSLQKTHISPYLYEFAKRIVHLGNEVTPFPVSALWQARKSIMNTLNVLFSEFNKGWSAPIGNPESLSELWGYLKLPKRLRAKRKKVTFIAHHIMMGMSGRVTALEAVRPIVVELYPDLLTPIDKAESERGNVYSSILKNTVVQVFSSSAEPVKDGKPLGLIAELLVIQITGVEIDSFDPSKLIISIPVLQIHGQLEEKYLQIMKEAWTIDALMGGDWKLTLRALTLPSSDSVYYSRNQDVKIQASSTIGKFLCRSLDTLRVYPQLI